MKRGVMGLLGLALLAAGGWYGYQWYLGWTGPEKPRFRTARIERGSITRVVSSTGTLQAVTTVQVGSQISGTVDRLYADFNSSVKKGQVIAQLDPALRQAQVSQQEAKLSAARAQVHMARSEAEQLRSDLLNSEAALRSLQATEEEDRAGEEEARLNWERTERLFRDQIVSAGARDSASARFDGAKARLRSTRAKREAAEAAVASSRARLQASLAKGQAAEADVEKEKAELDAAKTQLGYTVIRSPIDGIVISRNVDVGQTVSANLQAPTLFTIAEDLRRMQVSASIDEADIGQVRDGQGATFTVDAYPERTFRGKVFQIRNAPVTVQNVVTYETLISVDNGELLLKPGMTATVSIVAAERRGILRVPNSALRFSPRRPMEASAALPSPDGAQDPSRGQRSPRVWVPKPDGGIRPLLVRTGLSDSNFTEVEGDGLLEGQAVVVGVEPLRRGDGPSLPGLQPGPRMGPRF